jgi:hypothetical protein
MTGAHPGHFLRGCKIVFVVTILRVLKVFVHDISVDKCTLEHC